MKAVIVIPAYEPPPALVGLVTDLSRDRTVIVVDDGSSAACRPIFERVAARPQVVVLAHAVNRGKGHALKTAFNYFLLNAPPDSPGVVTADADGQHLPVDVRRVAEQLERSRTSLVLGGRTFEGAVPFRSRFGNSLTRVVVRLLLGRTIFDTQTGLRGIPRSFLPELVQVEGGRYEFELEMLVQATRRRMTIEEIPIQTVYGGAGQSHFNPLRDSLRIYFVFLRFLGLSIATAGIDYTVFAIAFMAGHSILGAMAAARLVAGTFNFTCNRITVFKSKGPIVSEALKYGMLVIALMTVSYSLVRSLVYLGLNVYLSKVLAEGGLFIASFTLQNMLVFGDRRRNPE